MTLKDSKSIFALSALVLAADHTDVMDIGKELEVGNFDQLTSGGFWIWDISGSTEFYSHKFRRVLGFNSEEDFPSSVKSWQNQILPEDKDIAFSNFELALKNTRIDPYDQEVTYVKKNGNLLHVRCSGRIIKGKGDKKYLVGTHEILENGRSDK